jgi:hypothetical protein
MNVGAIDFTVSGTASGHGWLDIYSDHDGGIAIGDINVLVGALSDARIHIQDANLAASGGTVDATFREHAASSASMMLGAMFLNGQGEVYLNLGTQALTTINQGTDIAQLDLNYQLADQDVSFTTVPITTITGFTGAGDAVSFNGATPAATNFTDAGSFTSFTAMATAMDAALDGTHKFVFASYDGTEDINRNGIADDEGSGVLALDDDGSGVTALLVLPGASPLTAADLA